jgi:hypothetical protein
LETETKPIASLFFDPIVCGKQQGFPTAVPNGGSTAARLRLLDFFA